MEPSPSPPPDERPHRKRSRKALTQKWFRLVHVYASMIALLVVLFFGITGLTLNHPNWTLGFDTTTSSSTADLPDGAVTSDGSLDLLVVSEYLRSSEGVKGTLSDVSETDTTAHLSYRGPGYAADVDVDATAGTYTLDTEQQGFIGVMNDLHKGRDTDSSWGWLIDVSAIFLVAISLTGLGLQLVLKARRRSALVVAGAGAVVVVILAVLTVR
ncbi:MAG: PepSY-associated TM helix domain-containing protein [Actinobacteria bacterium]|nr:PepSY-associated TM helix domain-containing protein [Actinomycetota bacterium]